MTAAVLTPFHGSEAVELGNRQWRKKVLPVGEVEYKGRLLHFTRDYLGQLVRAFQNRAYDQVPFQLADAANTHTNDPERTRGEITGMELGDDGLYVTAELTPEGEQVLTANPRLGVSARIVEDYARSDGSHFPAAIQHVLGTLDPRIPGLGAWQAIEAATPTPDTVIDLSASTFAGEAPAPVPASQPPGGNGMSDLTPQQQARLAKLLDLPDDTLDALAAGGTVITPDELDALTSPEGDDGELSDEDLEALVAEAEALDAAGLLDDSETSPEAEPGEGDDTEPDTEPEVQEEGEPVAAGLSAEAQFAIDLATAQADETRREMAVISARLREQDYLAEKRKLADLGVPPFITELARPLLEGAGRTVELANGKTADAGQVMRTVLTEFASQVRLLDLSDEMGSPMDEPEGVQAEQADQARDDLKARFKSMTGL